MAVEDGRDCMMAIGDGRDCEMAVGDGWDCELASGLCAARAARFFIPSVLDLED